MADRNAHPDVLDYSTPTCPDYNALEGWLKDNDIAFTERDLTDPAFAEEARPAQVSEWPRSPP